MELDREAVPPVTVVSRTTMDVQSTLSIAAEVGIGVAGFSTIAAAVLSRPADEDLTLSWIQLRVLLTTSLGITLFAYAPMVVGVAIQEEALVWRICSSFYALWVLTVMALVSTRTVRPLMSTAGIVRWSVVISFMLGITSVTLNSTNALFLATAWPYLSALACGILIAFVQFGQLVRGLWLGRQ